MKKNYAGLKSLWGTACVLMCLLINDGIWGQQNVFSRSGGSSNWWSDSNHPWFYETWNSTEPRPDYWPIPTRNNVFIGHNNNLTMSVNGAFFQLRTLTLQSSASSNRTFNAASGGGISLNVSYINASSGSHVFNVPIGVDGASVTFDASNSSGTTTFSNNFFINSNTATFSGSGNIILSGNAQGSGNIIKNGTGTLTISGGSTYTGNTTINDGILRLNRNSDNSIPIGNNISVEGGSLRISRSQTLNNLTINSGGLIIDSGQTLSINGTFQINTLATLTLNGTLAFGPNGRLVIEGSGDYVTNDNIFPSANGPRDLEINLSSGTATLHASKTLTGNLTLTSGHLNLGVNTLNRNTLGGTLTLAANTTLTIEGNNTFPSNYATHSVATTSNVNYSGTDQVVALLNSSQSYGNLILSGNGNITFEGDIETENLTNDANANTLVVSGQNIRVKSILTNTGGFTIENNANLIQEGSTNNNAGSVKIFRESAPLRRLDYTLWSAPVSEQNLLSFSPLTLPNRFYVYNPSTNIYNNITPSLTEFQLGKGYLIRMPDNHPNTPQIWEGEFLGIPHNGDVTFSVTNNTYNAVGNPYPSTLSATSFYLANNLTEPLYFWRKINGAAGSAYATWTTAGGATSGSDITIPNGIIQVGQGFIVRSTSTSVVFNNSMRIGNNDNQFLRSSELEHNRIRVAISGPDSFYQDVLVNYMTGATNNVDNGIDGRYINDSETAFYTLINEEAYVIQGRALPFDNNDVVPLGFKTTHAGNYQINLISMDGLFTSDQTIYLEDYVTGITHDFANGTYSFTSGTGVFHNRFRLKYVNQPLSVNLLEMDTLVTWIQDHTLFVNNSTETLAEITIFDLMGRKIASFSNLETNQFNIPLQKISNQVLLIQIKSSSGLFTTKKIIR